MLSILSLSLSLSLYIYIYIYIYLFLYLYLYLSIYFFLFIGKDYPVDYRRLYDHVRAKLPYQNEEPLDGANVINATNEMLASEEYDCLSTEFKQELMYL